MMVMMTSKAQQQIRGRGSYESLGLWEGLSTGFFGCGAAGGHAGGWGRGALGWGRGHSQRDGLTLTFRAVWTQVR